jgi:putative ABC transport system permease protein
MLQHYLTVTLRTLRRERGYVVLNVLGLAIGLACCMVLLRYVEEERSYDRFHPNADRIVRVVEDRIAEGVVTELATTPAPLAEVLAEVAAAERVVRLFPADELISAGPERRFQEDGFFYADSAFFEVFDGFELLRGDPATVLRAPLSIVLTESTARRYFGDAPPVGETLTMRSAQGSYAFTVTGIAADVPATSHLQFDLVASFASLDTVMPWYDNWWHPPMYTYALLRDGAAASAIEADLPDRVLAGSHHHRYDDARPGFPAQPLTAIHLHSQREAELGPNGSATAVGLFTLIALAILLIACINFMNLATARATRRAKEVGVRKAVGAMRAQLVRQFLTESVSLTLVAAALATLLAGLALPFFNDITARSLTLAFGPGWVLGLGALVLGTGLLAGSYPALVLSRFRPARVLKGAMSEGRTGAARLRGALTVFQFALSIVLLVGALVVERQLDLLREDRLGFDKEHVAIVPLRDQEDTQDHDGLKAAWESIAGVRSVAASHGLPGMTDGFSTFLVTPEAARYDSLEMMTLAVDADFAETLGLELVAGRDFDDARPSDAEGAFVLNEAAARKLGWDDPATGAGAAVGERLTLHYWLDEEIPKPGEVIGVVRDFQYHGLHQAPDAMVLHMLPGTYYNDYLSVRLAPGDAAPTLAAMELAWADFNPERPFEFRFLDEQFDALYRSEAQFGTLTALFTALAIFTACLGLFGLAASTADQRRKEVGVRKVLGASAGQIASLLVTDALKPVAVAVVVAAPVAYLALQRWLDGFAARVELGPAVFLLASGVALAIALVTVSTQALRAATANPVQSLRAE